MTIRIYNTQSGSVEPLETLEPGVVRLYVCGPTVYDKAHIGHAMSALVFDIMRRYFEYRGLQVRHVQNFTDVDDKIIQRAASENRDPAELAESYIHEWHKHVEQLGLLPATSYPRATTTMNEILSLIGTLVDRDHAYEAGGDVYFRVRTDADYGKLSHRSVDAMRSGTRIAPDERKDDPLDFALWKAAKPGEPAWPSPWGAGRPGWHIECSAMILKELGESIDIHGGGNDLIFPHHENEIAQSESATGEPLVRYWVHNGMLQMRSASGQNEKMSKSLGNVVSIDAFLAEHSPDVLRLMVLGSPYRAPLVYDPTTVAENERKLSRLQSALRPPTGAAGDGPAVDTLVAATADARRDFEAALDNDFNGPGATAALFDLVKAINRARDAGVGGAPFEQAQAVFRELTGAVGLSIKGTTITPTGIASSEAMGMPVIVSDRGTTPDYVEQQIQKRAELRKAKQFAEADRIREELAGLGIMIEDGPQGTTWQRK